MRRYAIASLVFVWCFCAATAWAQSGAIAGVVKDSSGAVLPGVTVEVSSPALIEGARTAVTDGGGLYKIVELRPGVYAVKFTLTGFTIVNHPNVELTTSFTATVNASLSLGTIEETIVVTAQTPVIDAQNTVVQKVLNNEVLTALPVAKSAAYFTTLVPGAIGTAATNQDVGGNKGENAQGFRIHGSLTNDFQQLREGMFFGTMVAAGNFMVSTNPATVREVVIETSGFNAEAATNGGHVNIVQRDGGNIFSGQFKYDVGSSRLQASNLDDALGARGVKAAPSIREQYDIGGGVGGPLVKNHAWFFASARSWTTSFFQPNNFYNATQGTLFYTPDPSRPAYELNYYKETTARITWQATPRQKITGNYQFQRNCNCFFNIATGLLAPEAAGNNTYNPNNNAQATWTFPVTNRLLLWAGVTVVSGRVVRSFSGGSANDISVLEQSNNYRYGSAGSALTGLPNSWGGQDFQNVNENVSASYVTGAHSFKASFGMMQAPGQKDSEINQSVSYTFRNRVPQSVTFWATPFSYNTRLDTMYFTVSDQWRIQRLTLNLGVRYDGLEGSVPEQHLAGGPFVPRRDFDAVTGAPSWKDINPRLGAAYDLRGDGKTVLKASLSRAVNFELSGGIVLANNPVNAMVTSANRTWNDRNGDYIPQESELGPLSNAAFGTVRRNTFYSDEVLTGWGARGYNWSGAISVQHELRPNVAVSAGYFRTSFGNQTVTDNELVTPADYDPYCLTAPSDQRLPGGGGNQICGLADVKPAAFGKVLNRVVPASKFGTISDVYSGVDLTVNARLHGGVVFSGGLSSGHQVVDRCFVVDSPQELYQCRISPPWYSTTQFKMLVVAPLPGGFQFSGNVQVLPSIPFTASYVASSAQIQPSLGRPLSSGATSNVTVELIPANSEFREGLNPQVDLRIGRKFMVGSLKVQPSLDLFNVFNTNSVLSTTAQFGTSWQNVTGVLAPRSLKVGVQVDF